MNSFYTDNIEIRNDLKRLDFMLFVYTLIFAITTIFLSDTSFYTDLILLILNIIGVYYIMDIMRITLKLDFLFFPFIKKIIGE